MYGQVYGLLVIFSHFMVKALEASCVEMTSSDAVQQEPSCLSCSYEQCAPAECDIKIAYAPRWQWNHLYRSLCPSTCNQTVVTKQLLPQSLKRLLVSPW